MIDLKLKSWFASIRNRAARRWAAARPANDDQSTGKRARNDRWPRLLHRRPRLRLGGGIGSLMSKHGLAWDDGLVDATVAENAGFVWGLRGGRGSSASSRGSS